MKAKLTFIIFITNLFALSVFGQSFTNMYNTNSPFSQIDHFYNQSIDIGDYDNDGDLDLIIMGTTNGIPTKIYNNDGQGGFDSISTSFPVYEYNRGKVKWVDFNNDGFLDIIIWKYAVDIHIYTNDGIQDSTSFTEVNFTCPPPLTPIGGIVVADINRNGLVDIIRFSDNNGTAIIENNYVSQGSFDLDTSSIISTTQFSMSTWDIYSMDRNKDGLPDFFIKFHNNNELTIYNGIDQAPRYSLTNSGTFSEIANIPPTDFNNNGHHNFISKHSTTSTKIHEILNDTVSTIGSFYNNGYAPTYTAIDYNNDGNVDIITCANITSNSYLTTFQKSNDNCSFTTELYLPGINYQATKIGDFDNDKDLDFYANSTIYKNNTTSVNTMPTAPTGLYTEIKNNQILLRWQKASDVETPSAALSYNVMIGTSPKGIDISSPMSDTITGFRRIVEPGNAFNNEFYLLYKNNFNIGDTIYWSVQTIDNGFGYSPFSQQCTTIVYNEIKTDTINICYNIDSIIWRGNYYSEEGIYTNQYANDSCINMYLNRNPSDTTVYATSDSIVATPQNASFQWWDCNNNQAIYEETNNFYIPFYTSSYAVEITENGCTYRSECFNFAFQSINDTDKENNLLQIFPNPNNGSFNLEVENTGRSDIRVFIYNAYGSLVFSKEYSNNQQGFSKLIKTDNLETGIYFIKLECETENLFGKLIIE